MVFIGALAFFMGFMMPLGIKKVSSYTENAIPWMWAINGFFSVVSSFFSIYFALIIGFNGVLFLGLGIYIVGSVAFILKKD